MSLSRIRIEVECEDSAAAAAEALTKYEHAFQATEAGRNRILVGKSISINEWEIPVVDRDFFNSELGREVTDEVIEKDTDKAGYKARRVVHFNSRGVVGGVSGKAHVQDIHGGNSSVDLSSLDDDQLYAIVSHVVNRTAKNDEGNLPGLVIGIMNDLGRS